MPGFSSDTEPEATLTVLQSPQGELPVVMWIMAPRMLPHPNGNVNMIL